MWRQRSCRIVRRTDVEETGIGRRRDHRLSIVGIRFCQRDLDHARAGVFGRAHAGFVAGIRSDVAPSRRSERQHRKMQRLARAGKDAHIFRFETLALRKCFHQFIRQPVGVPSSLRGNLRDSLPRHIARPERIFVGVDDD